MRKTSFPKTALLICFVLVLSNLYSADFDYGLLKKKKKNHPMFEFGMQYGFTMPDANAREVIKSYSALAYNVSIRIKNFHIHQSTDLGNTYLKKDLYFFGEHLYENDYLHVYKPKVFLGYNIDLKAIYIKPVVLVGATYLSREGESASFSEFGAGIYLETVIPLNENAIAFHLVNTYTYSNYATFGGLNTFVGFGVSLLMEDFYLWMWLNDYLRAW